MDSYSCSVKVESVVPQDFGAKATLVFEQGGGIDITPDPVTVHITADVEFVKPGAVLTLTLAKP